MWRLNLDGKSMGTVDNIFILHGVINQLLNENKKLYVAFIDLTKAFDYVIRDMVQTLKIWCWGWGDYKCIKVNVKECSVKE